MKVDPVYRGQGGAMGDVRYVTPTPPGEFVDFHEIYEAVRQSDVFEPTWGCSIQTEFNFEDYQHYHRFVCEWGTHD